MMMEVVIYNRRGILINYRIVTMVKVIMMLVTCD